MTQNAAPAIVQREITVKAAPARAFDFFTQYMAKWWPATHHIASLPFAEIVMEPRAGGRWFEVSANGGECEWGRVLAWDPPSRVILAWHLNPNWKYDPDSNHASEVEIRFLPVDGQTTKVVLTHSGFERHGEGAENMAQSIGSEGGWTLILEALATGIANA
jgi:uncharacterized protein YndB with AHSA1/START domain